MANLSYFSRDVGYDTRYLNFDSLIDGVPVVTYSPIGVTWSLQEKYVLLGGADLLTQVTDGVLTNLDGTRLMMIEAGGMGYQIALQGLTQTVLEFFALVQAEDWRGLADYLHQGDDYVSGGPRNDTLHGGDGDDHFRSDFGNDLVIGGAGHDKLEAQGGNDTLIGGRGADEFQFSKLSKKGLTDWVRIQDFKSGTDRIGVSSDFENAGPVTGPVEADDFHIGRSATTAEQGLIYHKARGLLYYDSDGSGARAQVLLAKLGAGTVLTVEDLWVI